MRLVHYMQRFRNEDGGVMRAVIDMCDALASHGHEVVLLSLDIRDVPSDWNGSAGKPAAGELPRAWYVLLSHDSLKRAGAAIDAADVLHLHVPWDPVCLQLSRLAQRRRVPYVITPHGMLDDWSMASSTLKKRLYLAGGGRRMLQRAAAVHCTSAAERDQSGRWFTPAKAAIVPLIFNWSEYERLPEPRIATEKFATAFAGAPGGVILFLSRFHPGKGLENLIDAAAILRASGVAFSLIIAGGGEPNYERRLRAKVAAMGLAEVAHFVGFVSGETKRALLAAADLFVLPSIHENWGLAITEAMACGTPVITTRGVNIWQELERSGGAMMVERGPQAIATAVAELLGDRARQQQMGQKARAWVQNSLHADAVVQQYEAMYQSAMLEYA